MNLYIKIYLSKLQYSMPFEASDLDKIDPDWKFAQKHAKSTKPGIQIPQKTQFCDCCLNVIYKQPISLTVHSKQLEFLGFGFPLWYSFLKHCAMLLMIIVITQSMFSIYIAVKYNQQLCGRIQGSLLAQIKKQYKPHSSPHGAKSHQHFLQSREFNHDMHDPNPHKNILGEPKQTPHSQAGHQEQHHSCVGLFIRLSRRQPIVTDWQQMLRISTYLITLFTLIYIRDTIYKTQQYYDQRKCTISDYSVMFQNLQKCQNVQQSIRLFIQRQFQRSLAIQQIILIPQMEHFQKMEQQKEQQLQKLQELHKKSNQSPHSNSGHDQAIQRINNKLQEIMQKQKQQIQLFETQLKNDTVEADGAIVIFKTELEKQKILKHYKTMDKKQLSQYFGNKGHEVQIIQAPQPRQILWQSINYSHYKRVGKVVLNWTLSILFIFFVTVIFYFILTKKSQYVEEKQGHKRASFIVYFALILVIFFNKFVMGTVLHHLTDHQRHKTSAKLQFSFALKYALGMFFTTALMTVFVQAIHFQNFDKHPFGVIDEESIMFFFNSLLVPAIWVINPFQLFVLYKRQKYINKTHLTQRSANHLMEDFNYDIGKRYAEVLQSIWFTFLYSSLIPMGSILTLIGIGLYYWVDKYNLLRRSSIHQNVSGQFSIIALKMLDLILVFIPLGWIIFDYYLKKGEHKFWYISVIFLLIGILYLLLPINQILHFLNKQNFKLEQRSFQQVKNSFKDTYKNLHPIYSKTEKQKKLKNETHKQQKANRLSSKQQSRSNIETGYI